jgi:hypothetical protein
MAELNFGLLNPPGSQSIGNAFVTGMNQGQEARARDLQMQQSMRQGQMAELQFKKAQDAEAKLNQFYAHVADNGGPKDPVAIEDQMIGSGIPSVANTGLSARMARLKIEQDRKLYAAANTPGAPAAAPAPTAGMANMLPGAAQPAPTGGVTNMLPGAAPSAPVAPPQVRSQIDALNARIDANLALGTDQGNKTADVLQKQADNLNRRYTVGNTLMSGAGGVVGTAPEATPQDIRTMQALGYPNTPAGYAAFRDAQRQERLLSPEEEAQKTRIALASRPPAQPRPEQPPVAVVDPATGKTVYVSREEALGQRMTPASAMEGLAPKEIQKREAALPAATSAVTGFDTKAKSFIKDLIALRDDVGLDQITGPIYGRIGSVSREGSRAQTTYDKIVAKGGFQALQDLRDASKTGGALGNVSNQEGKQLTASFAAIDRRQDAADVQAAINQAIADIEGARTRTREAYDSTYSYKSAAGQEAPAGAGKPSLADIFGGKKP